MKTVTYYMKGEQKQCKQFNTLGEARAFMQALSINPICEAYYLER